MSQGYNTTTPDIHGKYPPPESSNDILLEETFVAGDFICGVGYGIQIILFITCAIFLWRQRKAVGSAKYLLAYIIILMCIETIFQVVQARTVQEIYVDNREYPGGPWIYFLNTQSLPINVVFIACLFVLTFLSDLLVLWRCWVIWLASGTAIAYVVVAFPALVLVASFIMGTLWTLQSSQPGLSFYSALPMAYGTSYFTISLGVNVIMTILISVRLFIYRYKLRNTLGEEHLKNYVSLHIIIVESAALYSVFALLFLITYAINHPTNQVFLSFATVSQQIAGYLIIYRVAQGRAFKKDTFATETLPTMNFQAGQKSTAGLGSTATHLGITSSNGETSLSDGNEK
ncbi:hypothetical protein ONZ45_g13630 [Pleurotus djamor]|nr:hypothetical protein ONZ45_g13630 [Pleurotus djamor]